MATFMNRNGRYCERCAMCQLKLNATHAAWCFHTGEVLANQVIRTAEPATQTATPAASIDTELRSENPQQEMKL